jgi:4-amino-4-deoxy-L-arabinose transferase-like glycosyltransferase
MRKDLAWLTLVFGALCFFVLGRAPLDPKDEGRYAEIPREMVAAREYVTPRLDGITYFEKPPLMYWAEIASTRAFGPGEFAVRAPEAAMCLLGILLTYLAGRALGGRLAGLAAAVVLGTASFFSVFSHILTLDLAVAVWISSTLFCFILGIRAAPGPRRRWLFYGLYLSSAFATLTKGPIGFLLTGAVMLLWLVLCGQWKRLLPMYLPTGALLFLLVAAPWHLLAARRNPSWAHFYFIHENWERFTTTEHHRRGAWWYFIPEIFPGLFPWLGCLFPALAHALRGGWAQRKANADRWFCVLWAAAIFLFFSKSQSKLPGYILPVFPALAVIIGQWINDLWTAPDAAARARWACWIFSGFSVLLGCGAIVAVTIPGKFKIDPEQAAALQRPAWALAAVLFCGAFAGERSRRKGEFHSALGAMALTGALMLAVADTAAPDLWKPGTKKLAQTVLVRDVPQARVFHYHEFFHDFLYYSRGFVDTVDFVGELEPDNDPAVPRGRLTDTAEFRRAWGSDQQVYAVARKKDAAGLMADPTFHYHLLNETRDHYLLSNRP